MEKIAALFVQKNGIYFNLPNVDPWDVKRDAKKYNGPYPVICHPPCSRWCRLAKFVESRTGLKAGEDDGVFESALESVKIFGGILEHPAHTLAWKKFGLPVPSRTGGWTKGFCGGWSCYVEQYKYGHKAKKGTWLYSYQTELPTLKWGYTQETKSLSLVSWCRHETGRHRLTRKESNKTPEEFRNLLIKLATSAYRFR